MKAAQVKELRRRLEGAVTTAPDVLDYFASDASVFTIRPQAVLYPRATSDVQAAVAYTAEQASRGKGFALTARGRGSNQSGGALGSDAIVAFGPHMNRIKRLTKETVTVQPGVVFGDLQRTLHTHGRWLPTYPASSDLSTVGGAVANNASGCKSLKYGSIAGWVKSLQVVLDDGSVIETRRINRRELNRKKGLMTREGDIYRGIDGLIQDHRSLIAEATPNTAKNSAGYRMSAIKYRDGSIDLSQLFIGAQGTLGLITEVTLITAPVQPKTTLLAVGVSSFEHASEAILKLRKLRPSAIEVVDRGLLESVRQYQPAVLQGVMEDALPTALLLVEFDNPSQVRQALLRRRAERILAKTAETVETVTDRREQERWWGIYSAAVTTARHPVGKKSAIPIIDDGCVPVEHLTEFMTGVEKLLKRHKLEAGVWGHGGEANIHLLPLVDLAKAADRNKVIKVMDEFYALITRLGGTTTGANGDGILRAPYLEKLYRRDMYDLLQEVKRICDPRGCFNPRSKFGVSKSDLESLMRHEYSLRHQYDHLPNN